MQRKALYTEYLRALKQNYSSANLKETKASKLRSQSIAESNSRAASSLDGYLRVSPSFVAGDRTSVSSSNFEKKQAFQNKMYLL